MKLEEPSDRAHIDDRVIDEAKRAGAGITAILAIDEPWEVVVQPEISFPLPQSLEEFLGNQLMGEHHKLLEQREAAPAIGVIR